MDFTDMNAKVFISHSSNDLRAAKTICKALEHRGLVCWIASRDVGPGQNYMDAIVHAIRDAKVMVLVFSQNANISGEILKELSLASKYKLNVIPARIEDVMPSAAFELEFATRQWIDLFDDWEHEIDRLTSWIIRIVEIDPKIVPGAPAVEKLQKPLLSDTAQGLPTAPPPVGLRGGQEAEGRIRAEEERARRDAEAKQLAADEERRAKETKEREYRQAAEAKRRADELETQRQAEAKARQRAEDERRAAEAEAERHAEQERPIAAANRTESDGPADDLLVGRPESPAAADEARRPVWRPSTRQLAIAGALVIGAAGIWFATAMLSAPPSPEPLSAERERTLKPKDAFKECTNCPEMVVVPAGSFIMGSPESELGRASDESPQHTITFMRQFAVGRFALTVDEWNACVADGGCYTSQPASGRQPAINVSWDYAKAYTAWLSKKTGRIYRLLTEAEREYVTRADTTTAFWWGGSISTSQANYNGAETYGGGAKGESRGETVPVDSFKPNPWGLYQVHGNAWEWVENCANESYRNALPDGSAPLIAKCYTRMLRGGSWINDPKDLRAASRGQRPADSKDSDVGFRVAMTLSP